MTKDDVLFGYRLQLFAFAADRGVSEACRLMGVHRSTYYRWKRQVDRQGLEMLRPRERRRPQMPNQLSPIVEQRIVAFALGHPGLGPKRIATRLGRPEWGALTVSPNGVYKTLCRHGLNTRAKRLALVAGYRAPFEPPREAQPELHTDSDRPGELVGIDCFFVGRLHATNGPVWQITACDTYSSFAWADLVVCPPSWPTVKHTSALAQRVASELQQAGWQLERVLSDNGNEFGRRAFGERLPDGVAHTQIRSGRPPWTTHRRTPPRRPCLRCPQDGAPMSRTCRHNPESVQPSRAVASAIPASRSLGARPRRTLYDLASAAHWSCRPLLVGPRDQLCDEDRVLATMSRAHVSRA